MSKATHIGECQICGATQMLPNGVLSKHGYTVQWGFFSGVCAGAGYLPFEQATDRIGLAMAKVREDVTATAVTISLFEDLSSEANSGATAWKSTYHRHLGYTWEQVEVVDFKATTLESGHTFYSATAKSQIPKNEQRGGRTHLLEHINAYDQSSELSSVRHWVWFLNCKYAKHLRKQNESRQSWLDWQTKRLAEWQQKPLRPRSEAK